MIIFHSIYFSILYILITITSIIYWFSTRSFKHFTRLGINGPTPIPIFGNIIEHIFTKAQAVTELEWLKKYGKIYGYYFGHNPVLTVSEPELIKQILVKDFHLFRDRRENKSNLFNAINPILRKNLVELSGDEWKRIRSLVSPTFSSGKLRKMTPMVKECVANCLKHLEESIYDKNNKTKVIDLKKVYINYIMDTVARCIFTININSHENQFNSFVKYAGRCFTFKFFKMIPLLIFPSFILRILNIKDREVDEALDYFITITKQVLDERSKINIKYNDFVQLLMDAHMDEAVEYDQEDTTSRRKMTEEEIIAQALVFFLASYDNVSSTISCASYEMALNPDIQEKLYNELKNFIEPNGDFDYEILERLPYLNAVINETLRRYPSSLRLQRVAAIDYKLGDTGVKLYRGQHVEIPVYAIHHSEEYYPNPFLFDPDRFMPENSHKLIPYTYLPFGTGPRMCIGQRFSLIVCKLMLAQSIMRYKFIRTKETEVPLEVKKAFRFLVPKRVLVAIKNRE